MRIAFLLVFLLALGCTQPQINNDEEQQVPELSENDSVIEEDELPPLPPDHLDDDTEDSDMPPLPPG